MSRDDKTRPIPRAARGSGPPDKRTGGIGKIGFSGAEARTVYGANPVRELLARNPGSVKAIWVDPGRAGRSAHDPVAEIVAAVKAANANGAAIKLEDRRREELDRASDNGVHQGVLAWLTAFQYAELEALVPAEGKALIVALDGVEDPRNLGAILRSAYLLGAHGVVIPEHRAAQVTAAVAKTSAGASELLPIAQVGNLVRALDTLKDLGLWRVAVHATEQAVPIEKLDGNMPLCLVLGSEGSGVRPLVAKNCDFHAVIPMQRAAVGSFNVSVAAALALYEIDRQRRSR